jgi:hypothetical protein
MGALRRHSLQLMLIKAAGDAIGDPCGYGAANTHLFAATADEVARQKFLQKL